MPDDHLPPRPMVPAPADPPADWREVARNYDGHPTVGTAGRCLLCDATAAPGWHEVALHQLPQFPAGTVAVGWSCELCLPAAQERVKLSRAQAMRRPLREILR